MLYSIEYGDGCDLYHPLDFEPSLYQYARPTPSELANKRWIVEGGHIKVRLTLILYCFQKPATILTQKT